MKTGIELIAEERQRQIEVEGFDKNQDSTYLRNELAIAAASYAIPDDWATIFSTPDFKVKKTRDMFFPFPKDWWKPTPDNRIRELQKAGALIAAEIDRLIALDETTS